MLELSLLTFFAFLVSCNYTIACCLIPESSHMLSRNLSTFASRTTVLIISSREQSKSSRHQETGSCPIRRERACTRPWLISWTATIVQVRPSRWCTPTWNCSRFRMSQELKMPKQRPEDVLSLPSRPSMWLISLSYLTYQWSRSSKRTTQRCSSCLTTYLRAQPRSLLGKSSSLVSWWNKKTWPKENSLPRSLMYRFAHSILRNQTSNTRSYPSSSTSTKMK